MGSGNYRKEVRELIDYAKKLGFRDCGVNGSGHIRLQHENGSVTLSRSPSKPTATSNAKAQIKAVAEGRRLRR